MSRFQELNGILVMVSGKEGGREGGEREREREREREKGAGLR